MGYLKIKMGKEKILGKKGVYLREVRIPRRFSEDTSLEIFQGDIKKDKVYWIKYQKATSVRYFKLKQEEGNSSHQ